MTTLLSNYLIYIATLEFLNVDLVNPKRPDLPTGLRYVVPSASHITARRFCYKLLCNNNPYHCDGHHNPTMGDNP